METSVEKRKVVGWVNKIIRNANDSKILDIKNHEDHKIYKCHIDGDLPIFEGDVIYGILINTGSSLTFETTPVVKLSVTEDQVILSIINSQKQFLTYSTAKKIYDGVVSHYNTTDVDSILNNMSIEYMETQSNDMEPLDLFLGVNQVIRLLKWWYGTRVLRKLYLIGLSKKDVDNSNMNPDELYKKCLLDPFLVVPLSIDKCKYIYALFNKGYSDDQLFRATLVRKLYQNVVNKSWVGTPSKYLEIMFRNVSKSSIRDHMQVLREYYGVVTEFQTVYLKEQHTYESKVSTIISEFIKNGKSSLISDFYQSKLEQINKGGTTFLNGSDKKLADNFEILYTNRSLNENQKVAINLALENRFTIITGGAGTGKTTIIKELVHNLDELSIPYAVVSYTGKAVAIIKKAIQKSSAMTIHMMLARKKIINPFRYLIIDEASMVTTDLLYKIFEAFGTNFSICLLGDNNQLPPISAGNLFDQIIKSDILKPIILTKNYRSDLENGRENRIISNSENLIKYVNSEDEEGRLPFEFETGVNFFMIPGGEKEIYETIKHLVDKGVRSTDVTVITPYVRYLIDLNKNIQKIFNVSGRNCTDSKGVDWYVGDRVMVIKNNYSLNLMNGDEGIIVDITNEPTNKGYHEMLVEFRSGYQIKFAVTYERKSYKKYGRSPDNEDREQPLMINKPTLDLLTHCYAMSIHKSQGSEWEYVIFYLPSDDNSTTFINKNLIYTATTRPRRAIWNIGDMQALQLHSTMSSGYRHDTLALRLKLLFNK